MNNDETYTITEIAIDDENIISKVEYSTSNTLYVYNFRNITEFVNQWLEETNVNIDNISDSDKFIFLIKLQEKFSNTY